jgi:hypothetical protein
VWLLFLENFNDLLYKFFLFKQIYIVLVVD